MYVLGTAGHVDHGKSALVKALTGIDPDRLAEEKERGLTIELGFAWLRLPDEREVSIVDVPGHERFIKNMLAGVGAIDVALLIIAADEGVMPQTREHLAILGLLNVERGIVVITKKDLVDEEMLELVTLDAEESLKGSFLEGSPVIATSSVTGEGLPQLLNTISDILDSTPPRRDIGRPRLSVDRVFTMKGFGTVVTGTLIDGKLNTGQQIEILPSGQRATIRGLQTHKRKLETALPGTRVAVNLGGVTVDQLQRGMVLTSPGWLEPTRHLDVRIRAVSDLMRPVGHNKSVILHVGTCEVPGKMRLLDRDKLSPGDSGWAQMVLSSPVPVARGDLFIIRSASTTLGGGTVIETGAKRHRRFNDGVLAHLESRSKGSPEDILLVNLENVQPADAVAVIAQCNLAPDEARDALESLLAKGGIIRLGNDERALLFSADGWTSLERQALTAVRSYHTQFPLRLGMPREELRSRLKISPSNYNAVMARFVDEEVLFEEGNLVRLPAHEVVFSPEQQAEVNRLMAELAANPFAPNIGSLPGPDLLNALADRRQIIRISDSVIFSNETYHEMLERIMTHLRTHGKITVAEVRDMFGTSRKFALALMEYLDDKKVTRRVGDERVLR